MPNDPQTTSIKTLDLTQDELDILAEALRVWLDVGVHSKKMQEIAEGVLKNVEY